MNNLQLKKNSHLSEDECWNQLGYYGVALNIRDELPLALPEQVVIYSLKYLGILDYSKMFSLIVDWTFQYDDLLRADVFLKEYPLLEDKERKILAGLLEIIDRRRFKKVIDKIDEDTSNIEYLCGSIGRMNSYGQDPIMKKHGIICQFIKRTRDEKKVYQVREVINHCEIFKSRLLIGANARADFYSFRKIFPNKRLSEIRKIAHASKTSSVDFEKMFKELDSAV